MLVRAVHFRNRSKHLSDMRLSADEKEVKYALASVLRPPIRGLQMTGTGAIDAIGWLYADHHRWLVYDIRRLDLERALIDAHAQLAGQPDDLTPERIM